DGSAFSSPATYRFSDACATSTAALSCSRAPPPVTPSNAAGRSRATRSAAPWNMTIARSTKGRGGLCTLARADASNAGTAVSFEPVSERAQPGDLVGDRLRGEVLERPVVRVDAIAGGDRWMPPGELVQVFVDQRGESSRRRGCDGPARAGAGQKQRHGEDADA